MLIPKYIHFVFGFMDQTNDFPLVYYMSILSANTVIKPEKIFFHYHNEPKGKWWNKSKELITDFIKVENPEYWPNSTEKIIHKAHKADYIRLFALREYGGIYLDIDTITIQSIDHLLNCDTLLGIESWNEKDNSPYLCNAIMFSKPNSNFLNYWISEYPKYFKSDGWG